MTTDGTRSAREVIAERMAEGQGCARAGSKPPCDTGDMGSSDCWCAHEADAILAALTEAEWTVARLEQVGLD